MTFYSKSDISWDAENRMGQRWLKEEGSAIVKDEGDVNHCPRFTREGRMDHILFDASLLTCVLDSSLWELGFWHLYMYKKWIVENKTKSKSKLRALRTAYFLSHLNIFCAVSQKILPSKGFHSQRSRWTHEILFVFCRSEKELRYYRNSVSLQLLN